MYFIPEFDCFKCPNLPDKFTGSDVSGTQHSLNLLITN